MNRINRFEALKSQFPKDPTDYEDFEDIAPYNKLEDGKWKYLWMNRHPIYYLITNRFSGQYDGKLMFRELNAMKERIEKLRKSLKEYQTEISPDMSKLLKIIREQKKLCGEDCEKELQKHLDTCTGKYNCNKNFVAYDCKFKENGRCSHYYEIERADEEMQNYEYYEFEDKKKIMDLECRYERALAVKEDRLQEYLDDMYDEL